MTSILKVSVVESSMADCFEQFLGRDGVTVMLAEVVDKL
jgi:hypothetical protein